MLQRFALFRQLVYLGFELKKLNLCQSMLKKLSLSAPAKRLPHDSCYYNNYIKLRTRCSALLKPADKILAAAEQMAPPSVAWRHHPAERHCGRA